MKYLKHINEGIFGKGEKSIEKSSNPEPSIPKVFGNKFEICIEANNSNDRSNVFDNIYNFGIDEILSATAISKYIKYYFNKMDNESITTTLEVLSNDYNAESSPYRVTFILNKSQLLEFLELIKKSSLKLDI